MRYESLLYPKLDPLLKRFEISNILSKWILLMTLEGSFVECFDDINLAWQAWKSEFNVILDHHAPIRHMHVR